VVALGLAGEPAAFGRWFVVVRRGGVAGVVIVVVAAATTVLPTFNISVRLAVDLELIADVESAGAAFFEGFAAHADVAASRSEDGAFAQEPGAFCPTGETGETEIDVFAIAAD